MNISIDININYYQYQLILLLILSNVWPGMPKLPKITSVLFLCNIL